MHVAAAADEVDRQVNEVGDVAEVDSIVVVLPVIEARSE